MCVCVCVCVCVCIIYGGLPGGSVGEESTCNAGVPGLILGLGRSPGEENDYPYQYSPVFLPGEFLGQRSLDGGLQFMGSQRIRHDLVTKPPPPPYIIYTKCHFSPIPSYFGGISQCMLSHVSSLIALRAFRPSPSPKQCLRLLSVQPSLAGGGCEGLRYFSAGHVICGFYLFIFPPG